MKVTEPTRCFHCCNGHVELHKEKVKVNGKPEPVCVECYEYLRNMD